MERLRWILTMVEPTILLPTVLLAAAPLILLPGPVGILLSVAAVALAAWANHRLEQSVSGLPARVGPESMRGQIGVVLKPLEPFGTVKLNGEVWGAIEVHGRRVASGERVRVVLVRGIRLVVERGA